jgi:hypothetical protein
MAAIGIIQGEAAFRRKSRARSRPSFAARRDEAVWLVSARPRRLQSRMPLGGRQNQRSTLPGMRTRGRGDGVTVAQDRRARCENEDQMAVP